MHGSGHMLIEFFVGLVADLAVVVVVQRPREWYIVQVLPEDSFSDAGCFAEASYLIVLLTPDQVMSHQFRGLPLVEGLARVSALDSLEVVLVQVKTLIVNTLRLQRLL